MEVVSKRISLIGLTIELNQEDLDSLCRLATMLSLATKQNAYGIVKDLAGDLQHFIDRIIDDLPNTNNSETCSMGTVFLTRREDSREEDGGNHMLPKNMSPKNMSPKKRPKNTNEEADVANNELVKVSIDNMDDNCVLHAAISILGEFVSNNTIPVEAYIKQNKSVYVTEEQLEKLLDKLLAYNIKHPNKPLSVTIGG